ncbi:MAG: hypothetical protein ACPG32_15785 [Akkermansiaceae bacterium]
MMLSAVSAAEPAGKKPRFEICEYHDGSYVPYSTRALSGGFTGGELDLKDGKFHYWRTTDVVDAVVPDYKGVIKTKNKRLLLENKGERCPYVVSGKLDGRPVILTEKDYQSLMRGGDLSRHGILYLTILSDKLPMSSVGGCMGVSKKYPLYIGFNGNDRVYFRKRSGGKYTTLSIKKPYGVTSEEGQGELRAQTVDAELTAKQTLAAIQKLEAVLVKYHGDAVMKKMKKTLQGKHASAWIHDSKESEDLMASIVVMETVLKLVPLLEKELK